MNKNYKFDQKTFDTQYGLRWALPQYVSGILFVLACIVLVVDFIRCGCAQLNIAGPIAFIAWLVFVLVSWAKYKRKQEVRRINIINRKSGIYISWLVDREYPLEGRNMYSLYLYKIHNVESVQWTHRCLIVCGAIERMRFADNKAEKEKDLEFLRIPRAYANMKEFEAELKEQSNTQSAEN